MSQRFSPGQVLKTLRRGPAAHAPSRRQVSITASKHPDKYAVVLAQLFYRMADGQFKSPGQNVVQSYREFSASWRGSVSDPATEFYFGSLDAYSQAVKAGLTDLSWDEKEDARKVAGLVEKAVPGPETIEGLAWHVLLGQLQSVYSRQQAAETFAVAQKHEYSWLVADFFWDTGALTYYGESTIDAQRRGLPQLSEMLNWHDGRSAGSDNAVVISMDSKFFRIYAPMILFNAQQLPSKDFVLILCSPTKEAQVLRDDAESYLTALSGLNKQPAPANVRLLSVNTPAWVEDETTFYACARFFALPGLLEEYSSLYSIDADLFMLRNPTAFMDNAASTTFSVPVTGGLLGVIPWRRYMAGNMTVNQESKDSVALNRFLHYLSVGLRAPRSWMLDQNALSFAVEGAAPGEFKRLPNSRPMSVGSFMRDWERNFRSAEAAHSSQQ